MKIVWLDQNQQLRIPVSWYHYLQEWISKIADVEFYGLGGGRFIPEVDVPTIVEKENPDMVVCWSTQMSFRGVEKVDIFKCCKCSDAHDDNFERHIKFLNYNKINIAALAVYESLVEKYQQRCPNTKFFRFNSGLEHTRFVDREYTDRPWDCSFVGSTGANYYPLRVKIIKTLKQNQDIKFYFRHLDVKTVTQTEWNTEIDNQVELLNRTKITPFSNGIYHYPIQRWHEGMACGCLVIAEKPLDAEALHFVPYYNYVPIDENHFIDQIRYYLEHEDERMKIVRNAKDTFLKYNTIEIRAKELLSKFTGLCNG